MIFYLNIYIFFYITSLLSLTYLLNKMFGKNLVMLPITHILYYVMQFSKLKGTYYSLVVSLIGLPPFILFFIKFNFLLEVYNRLGFFLLYIIFLTVILKMFFYLQASITKNIKFEINIDHFNDVYLPSRLFFFIHIFLFFSFFSVFYLPDIYQMSYNIL